MKYLLLFTALIATAKTANGLTCQCSTCDTNKTCTVDTGKCFSVETEMTIEDKPIKDTVKGCQDDKKNPNYCKQVAFMTSDKNFNLMSHVICCDTDQCNKNLTKKFNKTVPSSDLVCPSCFALDKKTCDSKSMKCNNLQKKCFTINGVITPNDSTKKPQDFTAKGCAVENTIIAKGFTLKSDVATYKFENVQLVDAKSENPKDGASQISSCLFFAILLPSVLWFLLDSSLY